MNDLLEDSQQFFDDEEDSGAITSEYSQISRTLDTEMR